MPKTDWFKGVFPALVTPFDKNEELNEDAFRQLIQHVLPHVNGIVPCGTTGEFSYMTLKEREKLIDISVDEVAGKVPVVAGTGCTSTKHTLELTQYAKDAGAKAALVISPFYLKPSFKELYEHYDAVNKLDFPIIQYNIPQCTGVHKKWWSAEGIAKLSNVIGIKDSSGDMPFIMALMEKIKGEISIFCGHDEMGMPALAAGCDGLILASANLIPDYWQEIFKAVKGNDIQKAQEIQANIQNIVRIIVRNGANQAVKEGLSMMGLPIGDSRRPILPGGPFQREDREELRIQLEKLGKIEKKQLEFDLGNGKVVRSDYPIVHYTPDRITDFTMKIGEGFCGPPVYELAHIDLLIGLKEGPVGQAFEEALEREKKEDSDKLRVITDKPRTLLVPTVTVRTDLQAEHIYSHATDGVNMAIEKSIGDGVLPDEILNDICMIANVFVHPAAANRHRIKINNFKAMLHATRKALEERPILEELLNEKESARHPFKYTP